MYADGYAFHWDQRKSDRNLVERGFDFEFATLIFSGPTLERPDERRDYGECRIVALGVADGIHLVVVYTDRMIEGSLIERRIISARKANRKERIAYGAAAKTKATKPRTR